jgi:polyhydroxybutyrate depolymerase
MHSTNFFGSHFLRRSSALALLCCACSSPGADSATLQQNPAASNAPDPGAAVVSTTESTEPAPAASIPGDPTPAAPTSEVPISPELVAGPPASGATEPNGSAGAETTGQNGDPTLVAGGDAAPGPQPSARCGSAGASLSFNLPNTLFSVPASYDGTTPLPVVIAFHAAGNPNTQLQSILGNTLADRYIMFYPKSDGNGWTNQADAPKVEAIFAALDATACYDKHRVFATGHSSGAQFIVQRLCAGESRWRAVATVASSVYCSSWKPIPALVIHGIGDTERQAYGLNDGEGLKDIVPYRTSNGCGETYTAVPVDGCNSGGVQVDPGCRDFDGCTERTRWCQHTDPQYGTSHHGVPCFGARVIKDFFDTYL